MQADAAQDNDAHRPEALVEDRTTGPGDGDGVRGRCRAAHMAQCGPDMGRDVSWRRKATRRPGNDVRGSVTDVRGSVTDVGS